MTDAKKFHIRITFSPKKPNNDAQIVEQQNDYIYHWPRIIAVLLVLLSSLISGGYYLYLRMQTPQLNMQQLIPAVTVNKHMAITNEPVNADSDTNHHNPITLNLASTEHSLSEAANTDASPNKSDHIPAPLVAQPAPPAPHLHSRETANTAVRTALADSQAITTEVTPKQQAAVQQHMPIALFNQTNVQIFSPQIQRFTTAQAIINKEPVGKIADIQFDHNNIATVYAYSDVSGFVDQFLYYKWLLNGKQIARVKIGVWANQWRSYSHKFIQPHMHGDWSVVLENAQGKMLAISQFRY